MFFIVRWTRGEWTTDGRFGIHVFSGSFALGIGIDSWGAWLVELGFWTLRWLPAGSRYDTPELFITKSEDVVSLSDHSAR